MKYRFVLIAGALFALACQALFGNLSIPNGRYCNVGDDTCGAGQVCDPTLHACVDINGSGDGGVSPDGGSNPVSAQDFFAAPVVQIPLQSGANSIQKGVLYKANFDNMPPSDLFIMGSNSYTIVTFTGPTTMFKTVNYKGTGTPEMAAIGRLDDDDIDDVVLVFTIEQRVELITSKGISAAAPSPSTRPRAVAIGDYDGDKVNDVALGDEAGNVNIHRGLGAGVLAATPILIPAAVGDTQVEAMVTVPAITLDSSDSLALTLVDLTGGGIHRVQLIPGSSARSFRRDLLATLGGLPTDLAVGNFSGSSRDLTVLLGMTGKLNTFSDLKLNDLSAMSPIDLMAYRASTPPPLRGRLAVGRFFPQSVTSNVIDDLALLFEDGSLALYRGTVDGRMLPVPVLSKRALSADRIVAGNFALDQGGRDDLAAYSEPGGLGLLSIVRNNVGGSLGDMTLAGRYPLSSGTPANTPLVLTGKFTSTQKDDIVAIDDGPIRHVSRCSLGSGSVLDCSDTRTLAAATNAAATVTCPDQLARLLVGLNSRPLMLVDFTSPTAGETQVSLPAVALKQIEVADVNQDGVNDIVTLDGNNAINVIYGIPTGGGCAFNPSGAVDVTPGTLMPSSLAVMIAVGDVNGDNYPDLVTVYDNTVSLYQNSKDGRFNAGVLSNNNISAQVGVAIADLRAVRKPDVAVLSLANGGASSSLTVLSPDLGTGSLVPVGNPMIVPLPYRRLTTSDLGGDGLQELILLNKVRGMVSTASYNAGGSATLKHYAIGKNPEWFAVGQFDSDPGSPRDIVVIDSTVIGTTTTSLWLLQGLLPGQLVP